MDAEGLLDVHISVEGPLDVHISVEGPLDVHISVEGPLDVHISVEGPLDARGSVNMLFTKRFWPGLADGSITLTFRRWRRPQVRVGGRYHTPAGDVVVTSLRQVPISAISANEARRAGQPRDELVAYLGGDIDELVYRVEFERAGEDWRVALREDAALDDATIASLRARLERLDRASSHGPWTRAVLHTIAARPGVRAADLAASFGQETQPFKIDVRKLKALGLTESLEVGYRLSPRGETLLAALD
jgi:hypothetical protein